MEKIKNDALKEKENFKKYADEQAKELFAEHKKIKKSKFSEKKNL